MSDEGQLPPPQGSVDPIAGDGPAAGADEPASPSGVPATSLGTRPTFAPPPPPTPPATGVGGGFVPPADVPPEGPQPGVPGRLRIGSVLGRSIDIYLSKPILFIALALIPSVLSSVLFLVTGVGTTTVIGKVPDPGTIVLWVVIGLAFALVEIVFSLALVVVGDDVRRTGASDAGAAIRRGASRLVPTILSFLAIMVAYLAFAVGLFIVFAIPVLLHAAALGFLVLVAGFAVIVYVLLRWSLGFAAIVLDGAGPIDSLRRSWAMTRGNVLRLLGLGIVAGAVVLPLGVAVGFVSLVSSNQLVTSLLSLVTTAVFTPLGAIILALAYGDLTGRPEVPAPRRTSTGAKWAIAGGIVILGLVGIAVSLPGLGDAYTRIATTAIPAANRGVILFGTGANPRNGCEPTDTRATFTTGDTIYIGGYFSKAVPTGQTATVTILKDGVEAGSAPISHPSEPVICYYEQNPVTGILPGTYRITVTYAGETIAQGEFTVQ
ncbi:MAG TPA: hypothetical protein VH440_04590 [Candidatus Limnocylindrales bacterium]